MLTIEECRQHFPNADISNQQLERLRDALYAAANDVLNEYLNLDKHYGDTKTD